MKARPVYSYIQLLKPHTLNVRKSSNIVMHSVVTLFNFPVFQHWEELKIYYIAQNFTGYQDSYMHSSKRLHEHTQTFQLESPTNLDIHFFYFFFRRKTLYKQEQKDNFRTGGQKKYILYIIYTYKTSENGWSKS